MRLSALMGYFLKKTRYGLNDAVYQAFLQAYCLHPNVYVARRVVLEAVPLINQRGQRYRERGQGQAAMPYLMTYPSQALSQASTLWELFQPSIFDVSEKWEIDQESPQPKLEPEYRPTAPVMLTRFVKHLVFITMERADSYPMAVAIGSCLFTCSPSDACLIADLNDPTRLHNIGKVKQQRVNQITKRFRHIFGARSLPTKAPNADERAVISEAMGACTPWGTACFQEPPDVIAQLLSVPSERQRMHAFLCTCAGFSKLLLQWKRPQTMEIPVFPPLPTSSNADNPSDSPEDPDDPFDPPTSKVSDDFLNDLRISITNIVKEVEQRRKGRPFEVLRVCADYEEVGRLGGAVQTTQTFHIPADTLRVHVFGQDDRGEVPLGVFYMSDLEDDPASEPLYHVLESGATLVLTVSPTETADAVQLQLAFWPEEAAVPKTAVWYAAAVATAARGLELAQVTGDAARETDLRRRLQSLHHSMSTASAQGGELAVLAEPLGQWLAALAQSAVQWVSELWTPQWAGVRPTALDIPQETYSFVMASGRIAVTCGWQVADQYHPASIDLSWQANFPQACDIWVQFRQPDTERVLAEIQLGTKLSGRARLTQARLGFDPAQERWGLTVVLKRIAA